MLEATGDPASITEGLKVLKRGGIVVVVGIHSKPLNLSLTDSVRQGHQLKASYGAARSTWNKVLGLIARDPESFRPMMSHELSLERGLEGFELSRQRTASKSDTDAMIDVSSRMVTSNSPGGCQSIPRSESRDLEVLNWTWFHGQGFWRLP